ncbi:hypothetical protein QRD02_04075 [Aequorivita sp. SDUM287046]|uniref:DUF4136 domain-containing protein n=1 Tax=Aequorivita aurantiaca TaxID=3053356 RepID=A0ABT8DKI3_9FLAO|nr:hypothetical protein [Aequorivita aurantiaca]MDN3723547.1 hypothetical protein [Aequorivita aurantiaca]
MKKITSIIIAVALPLFIIGCSSVKVLSSWKTENIEQAKENNFIVIARTANKQARIAFENEIVKQMTEKGLKATASFTKFPDLNPDQKVTEESRGEIIAILESEGFNGVVLTVVKKVEDLTKTTKDGGYYAGENYSEYYPVYYGGFTDYYHNPMSYVSTGNYVPETYTTSTAHNYVLETLIYNLENTGEKQLIAVVTSKIEEPQKASEAAEQYVKAITKSFDDN